MLSGQAWPAASAATSQIGTDPPSSLQNRERASLACSECRRRKLKCDRQTPRCGNCQEAAVSCEVNQERAPRGPKKGYLKALRSRTRDVSADLITPIDAFDEYEAIFAPASSRSASVTDIVAPASLDSTQPPTPSTFSSVQLERPVTEAMHAELDQLYFDRIHPSISILHQRRYLSWSKQPNKSKPRVCLQSALWALTSLVSAQFQTLHGFLYQRAVRSLEFIEVQDDASVLVDVELAQAWILVSTYESVRALHRQAWMSAGRVFRLVQLMSLHELDNPAKAFPASHIIDHIELEEKRRTFWMAYFLDHMLSMRINGPITLNEHVICTRLPAPDADFQCGRPVVGDYLSETITNSTPQKLSLFNECIVLATLCGRVISHVQQHGVQQVYTAWNLDLSSEQTRWLQNLLAERMKILTQFYPSPMVSHDPLVHFANILGHSIVIYSFTATESMLLAEQDRDLWGELHQRALAAAEAITGLAKTLVDFHPSKIHPLTRVPLLLCAEFLHNKQSAGEAYNTHLVSLLNTFRNMRSAGDPSENYLQSLQRSCTFSAHQMLVDTS